MLNWTPLLIATFIASALSARIGAQASADLFVFSSGDRCGYIDQARSGLSPSFDACRDFSEGFAPVLVHDNWGFIDREGKIVIAPKFGDARWSFSEGLAAVKFGSKWGYINVRGDFAIPPRFEYAQGFAGGRAIVLIGKKHGVIDRTGKLVSHLYDSSWGYIDENGAIVIPLRFRQALGFSQGLAAVEFGDGQNQWGYIDHGGRAVIDPRFSEQSALSARNQVRYRLIHTILG